MFPKADSHSHVIDIQRGEVVGLGVPPNGKFPFPVKCLHRLAFGWEIYISNIEGIPYMADADGLNWSGLIDLGEGLIRCRNLTG